MSITLRLGVAGELIPADPDAITPELAESLAAMGIRCLVTHFKRDPRDFQGDSARRVADTLAEAGIRIAQAAGYNPNLVQPDDSRRDSDLARLRSGFASARDLRAEVLLTGCGSMHPSLFYGPHPENHTPKARQRLVENLKMIAPMAEEFGVQFGLECHLLTTLDTADNIREIVAAVDSPWVKVNFDPVNLIGDLQTAYGSGDAMREMHSILRSCLLPMAHIKDVLVDETPIISLREGVPGEGELDIPAFWGICAQLGEGGAVVVEHLPREQSIETVRFIRESGIEWGIQWAN